jgi:UDP-3-O-[3-hydroxymyristoyl] glucosamine N-acyltransferase
MVDARFYNISGPFLLSEITPRIDCFIDNVSRDLLIDGVSNLEEADEGKIAVLSNLKYRQNFMHTRAGACIVDYAQSEGPTDVCLLKSVNPYYSYSLLIDIFYSAKVSTSTLVQNDGCYISESAKIGRNCKFGYAVVVEDGVEIGDNCFIDSGSQIKQGVRIGNNAQIGAGSYISYSLIGDDFICLPGVRIG